MNIKSPSVLLPIPITASLLTSSTISEPDTGETAWSSGGSYTEGDEALDTTAHAIYACVKTHSGSTKRPELDAINWLYKQPSNKWAMFDLKINTISSSASPLTVVIEPGFFNAVALYNLTGYTLTVSVKEDAAAATPFFEEEYDLLDPPYDWWDWAFGTFRPLPNLLIQNITPYPEAELTITLTASSGDVSIGLLAVGDLRPLLDQAEWGGTEVGATAEPTSYAYVDTDNWGNTTIRPGPSGNNTELSIVMPRELADSVHAFCTSLLNQPVAVIGTSATGFLGLNTFGIIKRAPMTYNNRTATLKLSTQGIA